MKNLSLAAILVINLIAFPLTANADAVTLGKDGSVQTVLSGHVGKRVSVMLQSGQELSGTVTAVSDRATHLHQLTGKEFYDAVISNKSISAVIIRVK